MFSKWPVVQAIVGLLGGKTRLLVTHALNFCSQADHVIHLDKGCVHFAIASRSVRLLEIS